jgi:hypothetical protein
MAQATAPILDSTQPEVGPENGTLVKAKIGKVEIN